MNKLLAHVAHIEIYATDMDESVKYYEEEVGLRVTRRENDKVYLRCWGDYYEYSVILKPGDQPGLSLMAWRTSSQEALEEAARRIDATEYKGEWHEPQAGIGRSYIFTGPHGHVMRLFWEVEHYKADGEFKSNLIERPQRRTFHGLAPRQLDHITIASRDPRELGEWYRDHLGFRIMAFVGIDDGNVTFMCQITTNEKSHDLGIILDASDVPGRIHHYAYWLDTPDELRRAADLLTENGTGVEFGPGMHGMGEQDFLYFRDPSGLRTEVNTGGYRNYVPDWEPPYFLPEDGPNDYYRNQELPQSMLEAFPPAPQPTATEEGLVPGTEDELIRMGATHRPNQ